MRRGAVATRGLVLRNANVVKGFTSSPTGTVKPFLPSHRFLTSKPIRTGVASRRFMGVAVGFGLVLTSGYYLRSRRLFASELENTEEEEEDNFVAGEEMEGLPFYSKADVKKHDSAEKRIWVTYKAGVYDITEFVEGHPGGIEKIMLAAGGSIEPFWALYGAHKKADVYRMLEQYRIGNLNPQDRLSPGQVDKEGPYANDPVRHPILLVRAAQPFNAEPPAALLTDSFLTPNDIFYVRNHLPVPKVDPKEYKLEVSIEGGRTVSFTLDQLKAQFKEMTVTAAIQCSGNRRTEMSRVKPVKGLDWEQAAIGNAEWTGIPLRDVLISVGLTEDEADRLGLHHVQFEGLDHDLTTNYGASIPMEKAIGRTGDVILAFKMNGEELSADHGYPVRVIVPGIVGARNVKWLSKVIASKIESQNHWQKKDYKSFNPSVDWGQVDFRTAPAIQDQPVQGAICYPPDGFTLPATADELTLKGYALSGGGRSIIRVDLSVDGGKSWFTANLQQTKENEISDNQDQTPTTPNQSQEEPKEMVLDSYNRSWGWTLWEARVPVDKLPIAVGDDKNATLEVICKAVDSSYNTQPDTIAPIWNVRGVLNNAWHRIHINIPHRASESK
jgi:sulfite oxidase